MIRETKLIAGKFKIPVTLEETDDRIYFNFGFNKKLLTEIKAFDGARYHGYDKSHPRKVWSIDKNPRNNFQLDFLEGNNPYARFDAPLIEAEFERPLFEHQKEMVKFGLTRRQCEFACEMGTGKTLAAIEIMERSSIKEWYWVGPKSALRAVDAEFRTWNCNIRPEFFTYEHLVRIIQTWPPGKIAPKGVIFDEASRIKTPSAQRSQAAKHLADSIRKDHGNQGFIILMSGSPAPKTPGDWWHQCEVACPGFIKEGNIHKFKQRLGWFVQRDAGLTGGQYLSLISWKDDENKCKHCGLFANDAIHDLNGAMFGKSDCHAFEKSINEISYLYKRMTGLVLVKFKKDCLDLPDKVYKIIECEPSQQTINIAKLLKERSRTAVQALTLLRELSDGFQYRDTVVGTETCPNCKGQKTIEEHYDPENPEEAINPNVALDRLKIREVDCHHCDGTGESDIIEREAKQTSCPKENALIELLEDHDDVGRIVIYAGFTGSVDRCVKICRNNGWHTIRVDGRGWEGSIPGSEAELYDIFRLKTQYEKVAFVAQPSSAGMGLNLTSSPTIVYWSNDFNAESRIQSEDRIHRPGMDKNKGATIIDLIHLPTDLKVLENLKKKRNLQNMTLGEIFISGEERMANG